MLRIITRHGQIAPESEFVGNHLYPAGEDPLSDLGREQAALLGKRLLDEGFDGKILASPYMRTLETANIIAEITGLKVIPFAPIREIFKTEKQIEEYRGLTLDEIRQKYSRIDEDATLDYPWWTNEIEDTDEVLERVRAGVALAEELYENEKILYVGHGASTAALINLYGIPKRMHPFLFNCAISYTDPENPKMTAHCDSSHIPYEKTYSNYLSREEFDREYFESEYTGTVDIPPEVREMKGVKFLHIGDTDSREYPYFKKLIEEVKPDIILHTGDVADEVKVGRIPGTRYEYKSKIRYILKTLAESGAEIMIVPGNNDVADDIKEAIPTATVYPTNSVVTVDGVECRIGHQVHHMTFDRQWAFYGHGFTGDSWDHESGNKPGGECRFNASVGSFVCNLQNNEFYLIKTPKIRR